MHGQVRVDHFTYYLTRYAAETMRLLLISKTLF